MITDVNIDQNRNDTCGIDQNIGFFLHTIRLTGQRSQLLLQARYFVRDFGKIDQKKVVVNIRMD